MADAVLVNHHERRDASGGGHALIVGTEGRRDVDDTGTVFRGHIIAGDDAERALAGVHPRDKLLVRNAHEVFALVFFHDLWSLLEHRAYQRLSHQDVARLLGVRMHGLQQHIVDVRAHAQSGVARQRPRCGRPSNGVVRQFLVSTQLLAAHFQLEQRNTGEVFYVAVAARQVELVGAESGAGGGGVGLDGVALIEQTFFIKL